MPSEKALEILKYIRAAKSGRRWTDCEKEFVEERGWAKATFVKYWKEGKPFCDKVVDPVRTGRFRYFVKPKFKSEPEKALLRQRISEKQVAEQNTLIPSALIPKFLRALGEVITENVYGNPLKAWDLIMNLSKTTPEPFKEKFNPYLIAAKKIYEEQMQYKDLFHKVIFVRNHIVPFLLDKFSSLLYRSR